MLARQNPFSDKSGLGYTGESNLATNTSKEMKFVKAKEPIVATTTAKKIKLDKKRNVTDQRVLIKPRNQSVVKPEAKGKSLPKSQRDPRTSAQRSKGPRLGKGNWNAKQLKGQEGDPRVRGVMKMIDAFTTCLTRFTRRFESHNNRTKSFRDITPNASVMWVNKGTHA